MECVVVDEADRAEKKRESYQSQRDLPWTCLGIGLLRHDLSSIAWRQTTWK
jgi:hypothetical protein